MCLLEEGPLFLNDFFCKKFGILHYNLIMYAFWPLYLPAYGHTPTNNWIVMSTNTGQFVPIPRVSPFSRLWCGFHSQANLNPLLHLYFTVKSHYKFFIIKQRWNLKVHWFIASFNWKDNWRCRTSWTKI